MQMMALVSVLGLWANKNTFINRNIVRYLRCPTAQGAPSALGTLVSIHTRVASAKPGASHVLSEIFPALALTPLPSSRSSYPYHSLMMPPSVWQTLRQATRPV